MKSAAEENDFFRMLADAVTEILLDHPQGISEYALLKKIEEKKPDSGRELLSTKRLADSLNLFETHFLLFHTLYSIRDSLRCSGIRRSDGTLLNDLEIHVTRIRFLSVPQGIAVRDSDIPAPDDPLRRYYLDLNHLKTTGREDVEHLLRNFWKKFRGSAEKKEALAFMNLPSDATEEEIRRRFREMAHDLHPDKGGDPEEFRKLKHHYSRAVP